MNQTMHTRSPLPTRTAERGFTLVEIMVVIVILGLLATLVVPNILASSDEARVGKAKTDCKMIAEQVSFFYTKKGRLPDDLNELTEKDDNGNSYINELPNDPWDSAYELVPGDTRRDFRVISWGPDRNPGTEDDISNKINKEQ